MHNTTMDLLGEDIEKTKVSCLSTTLSTALFVAMYVSVKV